jgi:hypothetical protein
MQPDRYEVATAGRHRLSGARQEGAELRFELPADAHSTLLSVRSPAQRSWFWELEVRGSHAGASELEETYTSDVDDLEMIEAPHFPDVRILGVGADAV